MLFKKHISKVASVYYFHSRRLKPIRRIPGRQKTTSLFNTFVPCDSVLMVELPKSTIAPHQNAAAIGGRLDHVTPALYKQAALRSCWATCNVPTMCFVHIKPTGRIVLPIPISETSVSHPFPSSFCKTLDAKRATSNSSQTRWVEFCAYRPFSSELSSHDI